MTIAASGAASQLAYLLRAARSDRPVFLLGAGASYRAGIPLAADVVRRIARWSYARRVLGVDLKSSNPRPSDWTPYLEQQPWFITDPDRFAENFSHAVRHLLTPREARREFFLQMVVPPNGINEGYRDLADLMLRGLCRTVLTTNFDHLIVDALSERSPHIRGICEINNIPGDLIQFEVPRRNQIVYLHGSVDLYTDKNLEDETASLDPNLVTLLQPLLVASPIIVIGYRGSEPSVMRDLLERSAELTANFRHGIYWCTRTGESLHSNAEYLRALIGTNFTHLEIEGFDELMGELRLELQDEDSYVSSGGSGLPESMDPDGDPLVDVTIDELDRPVMITTLARYAERLGRTPVTGQNVGALLGELGLTKIIDGVERPTLGCYLLFGTDVTNRFPHACIAVTRDEKQQRIFQGNLISQYHEVVEYLDSEEINPILRVKRPTSSVERRAFPTRALVELVVNMLVHRDYNASNYSSIDAVAGEGLKLRNDGGIPTKLVRHLEFDEHGTFTPVRTLTAIRNPSLADVFYGLGPMDKAGSGLADVCDLMQESGGGAAFAVESNNRAFIARLFQPSQSAPGRSRVATALSPFGMYITNLLPFALMPRIVWTIERPHADGRHHRSRLLEGEDPSTLPIFTEPRGRVLSFANLREFPGFLEKRSLSGAVEPVPITLFMDNPNERRLLVWLLRKHWEIYLSRFRTEGLYIPLKENRAFFQIVSGERNSIVYDSSKRRRIKRDVVKRRGTENSIWHENEGIGYTVVELDGVWAIQIKPFYMFTGSDGRTPLPAFLRTARATRRMRFDRNKSVDDDLTFWARFLSGGQAVVDIGGPGVTDLVLQASYETFEVAERG